MQKFWQCIVKGLDLLVFYFYIFFSCFLEWKNAVCLFVWNKMNHLHCFKCITVSVRLRLGRKRHDKWQRPLLGLTATQLLHYIRLIKLRKVKSRKIFSVFRLRRILTPVWATCFKCDQPIKWPLLVVTTHTECRQTVPPLPPSRLGRSSS